MPGAGTAGQSTHRQSTAHTTKSRQQATTVPQPKRSQPAGLRTSLPPPSHLDECLGCIHAIAGLQHAVPLHLLGVWVDGEAAAHHVTQQLDVARTSLDGLVPAGHGARAGGRDGWLWGCGIVRVMGMFEVIMLVALMFMCVVMNEWTVP